MARKKKEKNKKETANIGNSRNNGNLENIHTSSIDSIHIMIKLRILDPHYDTAFAISIRCIKVC